MLTGTVVDIQNLAATLEKKKCVGGIIDERLQPGFIFKDPSLVPIVVNREAGKVLYPFDRVIQPDIQNSKFSGVQRESSEDLCFVSVVAANRHGPAGSQTELCGQFSVIVPQRIRFNIMNPDRFSAKNGRSAGAGSGSCLNSIDRFVVGVRKTSPGTHSKSFPIRLQQQERTQDSGAFCFNQRDQFIQNFIQWASLCDMFQQ